MTTHVILVDEQGAATGMEEKLRAHETGALHLAFSVFLFNDKNELLLHRRALGKYHSAGLWTNTCCSHPAPGESAADAAVRRLREEMGITDVALTWQFAFTYKASVGNSLTEHEYDHVFTGRYNGPATPDPDEVAEWRWASLSEIEADVRHHPERYTEWFKMIYQRVKHS